MKGREIIAEMRAVKEGVKGLREWCDYVEARADKVLEAFAPPVEPRPEPPASDFTVQETDGREEWVSPRQAGKVDFKGDPTAPSPATLVTPKQLGMIRALAKEARVDYEAECVAQLDCKPEDLSKRAASAFIDYLQVIKDEGAEFRKVG
jgi:hypothetical protein